VGSPSPPSASGLTPALSGRRRSRRCLLKGCEQPFRPTHPQQRYCSDSCRHQATQWRRWQSCRRYRSSAAGQQCRRQQSQRYRQRLCEQRAARWEEMLRSIEAQVAREVEAEAPVPPEVAQLERTPPREGQRPVAPPEDFPGRPCQRPGCYVLFVQRPNVPPQRFCSCRCRHALRCVLDREARWRDRRRRRRRPLRPARPPPFTRRLSRLQDDSS
jgi:hypothetical protein